MLVVEWGRDAAEAVATLGCSSAGAGGGPALGGASPGRGGLTYGEKLNRQANMAALVEGAQDFDVRET